MSAELAVIGADTASQQAGSSTSFFDNIVPWAGSSAVSGLASIYNTFVDYGSLIGVDGAQIDVARQLQDIDQNWYNYYKENKQLADVSGFIAGSLIPGTLAIKGLKAVQAGRATGAIGRAVTGPLNFAASKRDYYLQQGLKEIASEGGSAYAYINANKIASISWGFADNILQNAAFEVAALASMSSSPILADASKADILHDMAFGALVGGGIGGALDIIATNRMFKEMTSKLGKTQREYDTPAYWNDIGVKNIGDEAYGFVDSLLSLPEEVMRSSVSVVNSFNKNTLTFDVTKQLEKTLDRSKGQMLTHVEETLQKFGSISTPDSGKELAEFVLKMVKEGKDAGLPPAKIKENVGNYILGLESFRILRSPVPLGHAAADGKFYLAKNIDLAALKAGDDTVEGFLKLATSKTPFEENATVRPYQVIGDTSQLRLSLKHSTFKDAWQDGVDVAVVGNKMRINPKSKIFQQITEPTLVPTRFFNTKTGGVSDTVVATWADLLPAGSSITKMVTKEGVLFDGKALRNLENIVNPEDVQTATARHAWASRLDSSYFADKTVDVGDISLMERLRQLTPEERKKLGVSVRMSDGSEVSAANLDLDSELLLSKLQKKEAMEAAEFGPDSREVAYMLNTTEQWLEDATAMGNMSNKDLLPHMSRSLDDYLRRENFVATWQSPRSLRAFYDNSFREEQIAAEMTAMFGGKYNDTFVTGALGWKGRMEVLTQAHKDAFASAWGKEWNDRFLDFDTRNIMKMVDELGAGASSVGAANANYGKFAELWAQHTGKLTHQMIQQVAEANGSLLQPFIRKFQENKQAAAELGAVRHMIGNSLDDYVLVETASGRQGIAVNEVTEISALGRIVNQDKLRSWSTRNQGKGFVEFEYGETSDFLNTWKAINADRMSKRAVIFSSRGKTIDWDPDVLYAPPTDTRRYPFFALVKVKDGHIAGNSDVAFVTARSAEELSKLTDNLRENYDVFFKKDKNFNRVKAQYDAQLSLHSPVLEKRLRKEGKIGELLYEVRPENVMEDFIRFSEAADSALVRHSVDTRYAQLFVELEALGSRYTEIATSKSTKFDSIYDAGVVNPFQDYIHTALDISKQSEFPVIQKLNEFADNVGTQAYRMLFVNTEKAKSGLISWQEAERIATRYGVGGVFASADNVEEAFKLANRPHDRNLLRETVSKLNMTLATVGLRLDVANSIVNTISLPIMLGTELASLKSLAKRDPEAIGALMHLTTLSPDGAVATPSYTRLIGNAIKNVMGPGSKELLESYRATGDVKHVAMQFNEMLGEMAINPRVTPGKWSEAVNKGVEVASKWTLNSWSEDFTRALSANVMDQLTAPLVAKNLLSRAEAEAYRSVFVNRVNGNYIASQRPILFQGTVGAAVSLFQTYMFNVLQQLTRHIENRDMRAMLTMGGLQAGIYGFNGLPFFDAVNTKLIGDLNINDGHRDIYSATTQLAGKDAGDWLLYGTASAFPLFGDKMPAFYTRGDLNPRHVTILPVSPFEVPAYEISARVVKNLADMSRKLAGGADAKATLLEGLEHNGISRPLAGMAQMAQGYVSTSKGGLISASNDFFSIANSARVIGAKPTDEAVLLNTMFRLNAYRTADMDRLERLGTIVKTKLRAGQVPDDEEMFEFMKRYAAAGGNIQNYSSALARWTKDANMSIVNQMKNKHQTSYAQRLAEIMSGTTLDDFTTEAIATGQ